MKKYHLISIIAVVVLVLASLNNVVGFQTIQSSNQKAMSNEINRKELLFQTILDIANNKEIQRNILKSQISKRVFPTSEIPVVTKNQLKQMYYIGFLLSRFISKSRLQSTIQQYQLINPEMQQELSAIIENNPTLMADITQLQNPECDCENENTTDWNFPIICDILTILILYHIIMSIIFLKIFETFHNKPILQGIFYVMGMYQLILLTAIELLYYYVFNCPMQVSII